MSLVLNVSRFLLKLKGYFFQKKKDIKKKDIPPFSAQHFIDIQALVTFLNSKAVLEFHGQEEFPANWTNMVAEQKNVCNVSDAMFLAHVARLRSAQRMPQMFPWTLHGGYSAKEIRK